MINLLVGTYKVTNNSDNIRKLAMSELYLDTDINGNIIQNHNV